MTMTNGNTRNLAEILSEIKEELKDFIATRVAMLRSELNEKLQSIKMAAPVLLIGVAMLGTAWLLLTGFLVCIVAQAFTPSPWAYVISFVIVGVCYGLLGAAAAFMAWRQLTEKGVKPERTIRVLQQDRLWLQTEGKSQL